jgi:hypothetical protein
VIIAAACRVNPTPQCGQKLHDGSIDALQCEQCPSIHCCPAKFPFSSVTYS